MIRALPNLISLARLVLVPVVLTAIWRHQYEWAIVWCAVAGFSDGLDGFLARRLNATSRAGEYLDPIADKLLLSGTFLTLGLDGEIPWWLTAAVLGRDLLILSFLAYAMLFTRIREFKPTIWGKLSTAIQILTALAVLLARTTSWVQFPRFFEYPLIALTVIAAVWSGAHYGWTGLKMLEAERLNPAVPKPH